jgi:fatty-acid desaturase
MSWVGISVALLAFVVGYTLSMGYITVFYHRAFTHGAIELKPLVRKFVLLSRPANFSPSLRWPR